jgi:hypothetical protein
MAETPTERIRKILGMKDTKRKAERTAYQYKGIEYVCEVEPGVGKVLVGYPLVGIGLAAKAEWSGRFIPESERISNVDLEVLEDIARRLKCKLL